METTDDHYYEPNGNATSGAAFWISYIFHNNNHPTVGYHAPFASTRYLHNHSHGDGGELGSTDTASSNGICSHGTFYHVYYVLHWKLYLCHGRWISVGQAEPALPPIWALLTYGYLIRLPRKIRSSTREATTSPSFCSAPHRITCPRPRRL